MNQSITWRSYIFVALWAVGIVLLLWAGSLVDGYRLYVQDIPLPHPYPWTGVLTMIAILSGEVLLFYSIVRPERYPHSWGRALVAALVGFALITVFALGLMHAPPYLSYHLLWLVGSTLILLMLAAISAFRAVRARAV